MCHHHSRRAMAEKWAAIRRIDISGEARNSARPSDASDAAAGRQSRFGKFCLCFILPLASRSKMDLCLRPFCSALWTLLALCQVCLLPPVQSDKEPRFTVENAHTQVTKDIRDPRALERCRSGLGSGLRRCARCAVQSRSGLRNRRCVFGSYLKRFEPCNSITKRLECIVYCRPNLVSATL